MIESNPIPYPKIHIHQNIYPSKSVLISTYVSAPQRPGNIENIVLEYIDIYIDMI